jgi:hypothetical protein
MMKTSTQVTDRILADAGRRAGHDGSVSTRSRPVSRSRRRRIGPRALPIAVVAAIALVAGLVVGSRGRPAEEEKAEAFARAWARADYATMHDQISADDQRAVPLRRFAEQYRRAAATATTRTLRVGEASDLSDGVVTVPVVVRTRIFGVVRAPLRLRFDGSGDGAAIDWGRHLTFPGVPEGRRLERSTTLPVRADVLARDGTPLAAGAQRTSELGAAAAAVTGQVGPAPPERGDALRRLGYPKDAQVGLSGLERIFDERLAGRPGGTLRAGGDVLARSVPRAGSDVRTSIDPAVQRAAVEALQGRLGGIAALKPRTGEILALSGVAFSGLQPPGSTFKIVTLAGALDAKIAGPRSTYPVETGTEIEGVELANADGESCGGTLRFSFAHSCNSVFAPLGARLGARRLVRAAEAFGFNRPPGIPGAATSSIPAAGDIGDDLAVGSSAIGQGRVQATALQMGWVASTIAGRGLRPDLSLERGGSDRRRRVIDRGVARTVARYMQAVVEEGTGGNARIPGVAVAGKTGTAELRDTAQAGCSPTPEAPCPGQPEDPTDTDAWFAAFAPAQRPRVAVGVLLVQSGKGGDTAAPAAKQVLQAAL